MIKEDDWVIHVSKIEIKNVKRSWLLFKKRSKNPKELRRETLWFKRASPRKIKPISIIIFPNILHLCFFVKIRIKPINKNKNEKLLKLSEKIKGEKHVPILLARMSRIAVFNETKLVPKKTIISAVKAEDDCKTIVAKIPKIKERKLLLVMCSNKVLILFRLLL